MILIMEMERIVLSSYSAQNYEKEYTLQKDKKLRVAAYCRVSTDKEEQQTSFKTQCEVYEDMIKSAPEWELVGIYSDEGITGTSTKKRKGFQKMIEDCENGKIDFIITKSISRFARNTLDCLTTIRYLQSFGIQFLFEKEHIDTRSAFSEMLLTIMAAFAQEESRSLSENLKWGIRKRFENGESRWIHCYGYRKTENEEYVIEPNEANAVRIIFDMYQHGFRVKNIIDTLYMNKIPSPKGKERWLATGIYDILKNEKYVGDIILQKKYTTDHITHNQKKNNGVDIPAYYVKDHHTPIVSRKTFEQVTAIRKMRYQGSGRINKGMPILYPFGNMLKCPVCGKALIRRQLPIQKRETGWICENCFSFIIREWAIKKAILTAYESINMTLVRMKLNSKSEYISNQARIFLSTKETNPTFKTVEYFWVDDLIKKIQIGAHSSTNDRFISVIWKCDVKTTVSSNLTSPSDNPYYVAELYKAHYERNNKELPKFEEKINGNNTNKA